MLAYVFSKNMTWCKHTLHMNSCKINACMLAHVRAHVHTCILAHTCMKVRQQRGADTSTLYGYIRKCAQRHNHTFTHTHTHTFTIAGVLMIQENTSFQHNLHRCTHNKQSPTRVSTRRWAHSAQTALTAGQA